jgi:DNA-binding NtrC family response regulator
MPPILPNTSPATLLIVDDIPANLNLLRETLEPEGYEILGAPSGEIALQIATRTIPELVLLDIVMKGIDGIETCRRLKADPKTADIPVLFITLHHEVEKIVSGFRVGGVDYISRPFHKEELLARVATHLKINRLTKALSQKNNELEQRTLELTAANEKLRQEISEREKAEAERERVKAELVKAEEQLSLVSQLSTLGFIGQSETIKRDILQPLQKLSANDKIPVLITGESGTGKELITQAIHLGGQRAKGRFIPVNCAAISEQLVESELFGHLKGAFTGATSDKVGKFEAADGGTIFLDEIGDMKLDIQAKILRVLQEDEVVKVGSNRAIKVDVRFIAATNKDIEAEVVAGRFRSDLYYRLKGFRIVVPPLRERREDIPLLVLHFLKRFGARMHIEHPAISPEALSLLKTYHFPGNVRELERIIEAALTLSGTSEIRPEHLNFIKANSPLTVQPPSVSTPTPPARGDREALMLKRVQGQSKGQQTDPSPKADEEKILAYIREHSSINNSECRDLLSVDLHRASYLLKKMQRYGLLVREGEHRWSHYRLA